MAAFFASLSATEALAVSAILPSVGVLAAAWLVVEAGRFIRLALRGR